MKIGMRKPSIKRSVRARTTGRVKRAVKKSVNPLYGKKGVGFIKDPGKSVKNAVYHKTTFGMMDVVDMAQKESAHSSTSRSSRPGRRRSGKAGFVFALLVFLFVIWASARSGIGPFTVMLVIIGIVYVIAYFASKKEDKES